MGLIGNKFRNSTGAHRNYGDVPALVAGNTFSNASYSRAQDGSATVLKTTSFPEGQPNGWFPPHEAGGMAMRADSSGILAGNLVPTYPMSIDLTGTSSMTALGALVAAMQIAMTGSGTMTATITGLLNASIDMTGTGGLTASMTALANMIVALSGTGSVAATIGAIGNMSIDIVVTGTGLTTENVGQAVWAALAAANAEPGTMGELLTDAEAQAGVAAAMSI